MTDTAMIGKRLHVCVMNSRSGIADYARDFQRLVLGPVGYVPCDPAELPDRVGAGSGVECHVQLGVSQQAERRAVSRLLREGCAAVDATIHDPPFTSFPFFGFQSPLLTRFSRGFDWYLGSFGLQRRMLERLRRIFVLSELGKAAILRLAPRANVIVMPHIVDRERVWDGDVALGKALIYFGFIGPNKGLDYALEVHAQLRRRRPGIRLHVVGQPGSQRARRYLEGLQQRYAEDVTYHGYIPEEQLDSLFAQAAHVILPYAPYRHIVPTSGSVIHALRRGRIVWTTSANAMPELISDGQNGFMLTQDPEMDAQRLAQVIDDPRRALEISDAARSTALAMADFPYRRLFDSGAAAKDCA